MKSTIVDRIEDVEPPLAHMIPELSSNLLLPLVVVIAMFAIDWRMGLALLVTIPVALIPMAFGMRTYNKNYAAYMEANAHVNSVIVEYVEGIQVVKAFSQGERSYQKFAQAVASLPGLHHGMVPLHLGLHESVPVHSADHPAGGRRAGSGPLLGGGGAEPAVVTLGGRVFLPGGVEPGRGSVPDAGPGNRVPPDERHRLHQLHEKYAVCSKGHP